MRQKATGFQQIITGNKSWFFFYHPRDSVRVTSRDELPQRIKQRIDTEECLVSIHWSVNGIHSFLNVPKGITYNTTFFIDFGLPSLIENFRSRTRRKTLKGWLIHIDKRVLTIRGELKSVWKPQESNACQIQHTAET
jgi:hypothetical protein